MRRSPSHGIYKRRKERLIHLRGAEGGRSDLLLFIFPKGLGGEALIHSSLVLFFADFVGDSLADFLESGKVPCVREPAALLRFHGLNFAAPVFEEDTLVVGFVL